MASSGFGNWQKVVYTVTIVEGGGGQRTVVYTEMFFHRVSRLSAARRWHLNNPVVMNDVCPPRLTHDEPVTFLIVRARPHSTAGLPPSVTSTPPEMKTHVCRVSDRRVETRRLLIIKLTLDVT